MIKHTDLRNKGQGKKNLGEYEQSAEKALASMVVYELGYGGVVTDISPTRVVVETYILGGTSDTTIFEGSEGEMEFIVRVAAHHVMMFGDEESKGVLVDKAAHFLGTLPKEVGGLPLYIAALTPFLIGVPSASCALLFAAGITDPEAVKAMGPISLKDLVAAVQLHRETGVSLQEITAEMKVSAV